jgi:multidrug efflux system outer membrane protein
MRIASFALGCAAAAVAAALSAGCASVGPNYHAPESIAAGQRLGAPAMSDSSRAFFDSLAAARRRDSVPVAPAPAVHRLPPLDSATDLAWLDILRDTALIRMEQTAVAQNRDVETAVARIREYRADVGTARAAGGPNINANAAVSTNRVALGSFVSSYNAFAPSVSASWEIDVWGRIRRGVEAANADLAAQQAAERATVLSLVSDVATGYIQLLELDQERTIAERTLSSRKATLDLARQRYAQGLTSELDVRQFEAAAAAPAVTLADAVRASAQEEHNLSLLLGDVPRHVTRGGSLAAAARALVVPDSISSTLLARRPDVEQAEREYAAATARIGVAEAARFPPVMITGSFGTQATTPAGDFNAQSRVYQLQLGLSLPLFTNGRVESGVAAARARADQARAQYEQVTLSAMRDASDALVAARTARDDEVAQETQAQALRAALDLAQVRYQAGLATYLDVLDAERSLFSAELSLSQAQLGQLTAAVQLYKALGGSWTPR